MNPVERKIQEIKKSLFYLREGWSLVAARFVRSRRREFFLFTVQGRKFMKEEKFQEIIALGLGDVGRNVYYSITDEPCSLKQSQEAMLRLADWLINSIQLEQEMLLTRKAITKDGKVRRITPNELWSESAELARIILSNQEILNKRTLNLVLRYFDISEAFEYFKVKESLVPGLLARMGMETVYTN
jgi:hypothetical protein